MNPNIFVGEIVADLVSYNVFYSHALIAEKNENEKSFNTLWEQKNYYYTKLHTYAQLFHVCDKVLFDFHRIMRKHPVRFSQRKVLLTKLIDSAWYSNPY